MGDISIVHEHHLVGESDWSLALKSTFHALQRLPAPGILLHLPTAQRQFLWETWHAGTPTKNGGIDRRILPPAKVLRVLEVEARNCGCFVSGKMKLELRVD